MPALLTHVVVQNKSALSRKIGNDHRWQPCHSREEVLSEAKANTVRGAVSRSSCASARFSQHWLIHDSLARKLHDHPARLRCNPDPVGLCRRFGQAAHWTVKGALWGDLRLTHFICSSIHCVRIADACRAMLHCNPAKHMWKIACGLQLVCLQVVRLMQLPQSATHTSLACKQSALCNSKLADMPRPV